MTFAPETENPTFHPGRTAVISSEGDRIGVIGEVHPAVTEKYDIRARVYLRAGYV